MSAARYKVVAYRCDMSSGRPVYEVDAEADFATADVALTHARNELARTGVHCDIVRLADDAAYSIDTRRFEPAEAGAA